MLCTVWCQVKQYRVEQARILDILTPFEVKRIEKKKQSEVNREDYDYFMDDSRNIWKDYKVPDSKKSLYFTDKRELTND